MSKSVQPDCRTVLCKVGVEIPTGLPSAWGSLEVRAYPVSSAFPYSKGLSWASRPAPGILSRDRETQITNCFPQIP